MTREVISVWRDDDSGEWIVSHDWVDATGGAEYSLTISTFDDDSAAVECGRQEAEQRGLPLVSDA